MTEPDSSHTRERQSASCVWLIFIFIFFIAIAIIMAYIALQSDAPLIGLFREYLGAFRTSPILIQGEAINVGIVFLAFFIVLFDDTAEQVLVLLFKLAGMVSGHTQESEENILMPRLPKFATFVLTLITLLLSVVIVFSFFTRDA